MIWCILDFWGSSVWTSQQFHPLRGETLRGSGSDNTGGGGRDRIRGRSFSYAWIWRKWRRSVSVKAVHVTVKAERLGPMFCSVFCERRVAPNQECAACKHSGKCVNRLCAQAAAWDGSFTERGQQQFKKRKKKKATNICECLWPQS